MQYIYDSCTSTFSNVRKCTAKAHKQNWKILEQTLYLVDAEKSHSMLALAIFLGQHLYIKSAITYSYISFQH